MRHALLGSGPGLNASAFPYRPLTTLTFRGCGIQDGGATNIAEILKPSAAACQVRDQLINSFHIAFVYATRSGSLGTTKLANQSTMSDRFYDTTSRATESNSRR
jgi:hypothetical protein